MHPVWLFIMLKMCLYMVFWNAAPLIQIVKCYFWYLISPAEWKLEREKELKHFLLMIFKLYEF